MSKYSISEKTDVKNIMSVKQKILQGEYIYMKHIYQNDVKKKKGKDKKTYL